MSEVPLWPILFYSMASRGRMRKGALSLALWLVSLAPWLSLARTFSINLSFPPPLSLALPPSLACGSSGALLLL
jgi:hypothetical protein